MPGKVVVVGSLSRDLVFRVPRRPATGETLIAHDFQMYVGGKGNNQAMAAARAGAQVSMVGRIGEDDNGDVVLECLHKSGVDTKFLLRDKTVGTGIANIYVDDAGDNSIVIAPQSNGRLSPADILAARETIAQADVMLLQLEVPIETTIAAAQLGRELGLTVIVNPAPAPDPESMEKFSTLLKLSDIIVPNQSEAQLLCGLPVNSAADAAKASAVLQERGGSSVLITLAEQGAFYLSKNGESTHIPAFKVSPIDTTAAGDAFCGALAAAMSAHVPLADSISFACAAGALATTIGGAEPSLPQRAAIEELISSQSTAKAAG